ncbi:MAG TPA: CcmD family protein [Longimicrobiaceae bacterium]|nr:CcmD family protein [Longimicrobiaceae bacterium]
MRTARISTLLLAAVLLAAAPLSLRAQEPSYAAPAAAAQAPADPAPSVQAPPQTSTGLPQRAAPPRTLRDYTHVFAAFAIAWLLLFGYVVSIGRRWARVEQELATRG